MYRSLWPLPELGTNLLSGDAVSGCPTGQAVVQRYLTRAAEMVRRGALQTANWGGIWLGPRSRSSLLDTYCREAVRVADRRGLHLPKVHALIEAAQRTAQSHLAEASPRRAQLGLMPGTFDPIHSGHLCTALAAVTQRHLGGVVFAVGGSVPEKPEVTAFEHRMSMIERCAAAGSQGWIAQTPLRRLMADRIGRAFCFRPQPKRPQPEGQSTADGHEIRRLGDIAAFSLLFSMNPNVSWTYVTGSDKVNKYGTADEEDLVNHTLAHWNVKVTFFERDVQPVSEASIGRRLWLRRLWEGGMFERLDVPLYGGTSATAIRDGIADMSDAISDDVEPPVLAYAVSRGLRELYAFSRDVRLGRVTRGSPAYREGMARFSASGLVEAAPST